MKPLSRPCAALFLALWPLPAAAQWFNTDRMRDGRESHTATLLPDGRLLVCCATSGGSPAAEAYDPVSGRWSSVAAPSVARSEHTATLLPNGKVLMAGGSASPATAELYDPALDLWEPTGALNTGRYRHTATLLPDDGGPRGGTVLVAGGVDAGTVAELYDPETGQWTLANPMPTSRHSPTATLLADGRVVVIGGFQPVWKSAVEIYDPSTGDWSSGTPLTLARSRHTATLLADGTVLVTGGYAPGGPAATASAAVYDPVQNSWTNVGPLNWRRVDHDAVLLPSGQVLIVGGIDPAQSVEIYDPSARTFTVISGLNTDRWFHTASLLPTGHVLVAGGTNQGALASAEIWSPSAGSWTTTTPMSAITGRHSSTLLPDGRLLVVGDGAPEVYDESTGMWSTLDPPPITGTIASHHCAALLHDGRVLFAGVGTNGGTNQESALFDWRDSSWELTDSLTYGRGNGCTATTLNDGRVLVAGGLDVPIAELYDPATGLFTDTGALPTWVQSHTATLLSDGNVLLAGGSIGSSAYIYDVTAGTWNPTGSMARARSLHVASLLPDGTVLVAGGLAGNPLASAERYSPATGTWASTGSLAKARFRGGIALLRSGSVALAGGTAVGGSGQQVPWPSVEVYDPLSGTWSSGGSMSVSRDWATLTVLPSGAALAVGGGSATAELFTPPTVAGRRPLVTGLENALSHAGPPAEITGQRFGSGPGVSGRTSGSADSHALVHLHSIASPRVWWLAADPPLPASEVTATLTVSALPAGLDPGWYAVTVERAGIHSTARIVGLGCEISIDTPPADATAPVGGTATFAVEARGVRSYQWMKDGVDIEGAVSPSYQTPPIAGSDAGTRYSVRVSGACATETSAEATLFVEDLAAPQAAVVSPAGGEYWLLSQPGQPASTQVVAWSMSDNVRICRVEARLLYSNDGGATYAPVPAAVNLDPSGPDGTAVFGPGGACTLAQQVSTTSLPYTVPTTFPSGVSGSLYKVEVKVTDHAGLATTARSTNPFYIVQSNPDSVRTLILHNVPRMQARMGISGAQAAALRTKLAELANHPRVQGLLVDLSTRTELGELYTVWDDAYGSDPSTAEGKANNVLFGCHLPYPSGCPTDVERDGVHDVVRELVRIYSGTKYLVIVGDDRIVPLARLTDRTSLFPESNYTGPGLDLTETGTTVGRALEANKYLSDDPLSVLDAVSAGELGGSLFVPDLAAGRLVERPEEITTTIATFISQEGVVDLSALDPVDGHKVLVESYDFLTDAGKQIRRRWKSALGVSTPDNSLAPVDGSLLEGNWGLSTVEERRAELRAHLSGNGGSRYAVMSFNGHATHFEEGVPGTSAQDIEGLGSWDIYGPEPVVCDPVTPSQGALTLAGAVAYGVGCHGGLPVAGSCAADADHSLDLPQTMLARGVVAYVANTGYGWGLKSGIGYGERLVEVFSEELSKGGTVVVGDAVKRAKARYLLETPRFDAYDEKSLMQWTLFGLPMYAVATGIGSPAASLRQARSVEQIPERERIGSVVAEAREPKASLPAFLTQLNLHFDFTAPGVYTKRNAAGDDLCPASGEPCPSGCPDPAGCYYTLNNLVERATGAADIPVQPYFIYDSRLSGTSQHGVLWKGGIYEEEGGWVPVTAELVSNGGDASDHGSAPRTIIISTVSPRLVPGSDPAQCRPSDLELNSLVVSAGEALKDQESDLTYSIQRRYREIDLEAFYFNDTSSPSNNCDREGPALGAGPFSGEYHQQGGGAVSWSVPASDPAGVWRVLVVFNANTVDGDGRGTWEPVELAFDAGSGTWTGSRATAGRVTYVIQAVDRRGNVTWHRFVSAQLPASGVPLDVANTVDVSVNVPPTALADGYTATAGAELSVSAPGVLGNDTDAEDGNLSAVPVSPPAHGSLTLNTDGSFTYTPDPAWRGADIFTYRASDGQDLSVTTTVTLDVGASTDLALDMDGARTGREVAFTITVSNDGPSQATGVTLTDAVPSAASVRSVSPSQGSCNVSATRRGPGTVICTLGTLSPAAGATVQLTLRLPRRIYTNTASVSGVESDPDSSNNTTEKQVRIGMLRVEPAVLRHRLEYGGTAGRASVTLHNDDAETMRMHVQQARQVGSGLAFGVCASEAACALPWLSISPARDLLSAHSEGTLEAVFSAERLTPGLRRTWLRLADEAGGELATLPVCFTVGFLDVPAGNLGDEAIHALAGEGIARGCARDRFCPAASLTRREAAVWLLRAKDGRGYQPQPAEGRFDDVAPDSFGADAIEELAQRGIVKGCAERKYCPDQPLTRGQMAAVLTRTFGRATDGVRRSFRPDEPIMRAEAAAMLAAAGGLGMCMP